MPAYALRCPAKGCGHTCEVKRKMGEEPEQVCPKCLRTIMRTVIQPTPRVWGKGGKP